MIDDISEKIESQIEKNKERLKSIHEKIKNYWRNTVLIINC